MARDKLTTKFQAALSDAQSLAVGRDNQFIEPVHLMAALLDQQGGTARPLLEKSGANVAKLRSELAGALERLPKVEGSAGDVGISSDLNKLLNVTDKLAQKRGDQFISSELFVLAACEDRGELGRILKSCGAEREALEKAIEEVRGGSKVDDAGAEENRDRKSTRLNSSHEWISYAGFCLKTKNAGNSLIISGPAAAVEELLDIIT